MVLAKCISKNRNYRGRIISYTLQDQNGKQRVVNGHQLKEAMQAGRIDIVNLKIDRAGRLVDKVELVYKKSKNIDWEYILGNMRERRFQYGDIVILFGDSKKTKDIQSEKEIKELWRNEQTLRLYDYNATVNINNINVFIIIPEPSTSWYRNDNADNLMKLLKDFKHYIDEENVSFEIHTERDNTFIKLYNKEWIRGAVHQKWCAAFILESDIFLIHINFKSSKIYHKAINNSKYQLISIYKPIYKHVCEIKEKLFIS